MTRTHRLAALVAALLLGAAAQAQQCQPCMPVPGSCGYCPVVSPPCAGPADCYSPGACQATEAPRAPYYWELPQVLYPPQALTPSSNPALWAQLFEAIARTRGEDAESCDQGLSDVQSDPRERARHRSRQGRMACELLKLYRLFYHHGHYKAAEIVAEKALRLDPTNPAAEQAAAMAHHMIRVSKPTACHEECSPPTSGPSCGMCRPAKVKKPEKPGCACAARAASKIAEGCCCARKSCGCADGRKSCGCAKAAKGCCCEAPARKKTKARTSCACGENCSCCKDCGSADRQNVQRIRRVIRPVMIQLVPPPIMPMPPPIMPMPPSISMPMPQVMTPPMPGPLPGMIPLPPPPGGMPCPPWAGTMPPWSCPLPGGHPERIPAPQLVDDPPTQEIATEVHPPMPRMRIMAGGKHVRMASPHLEARCETMTPLGDGRILLEGDVVVDFHVPGQPAKIQADRMIVNPADGSYEVNPVQPSPTLRQILHEQPW